MVGVKSPVKSYLFLQIMLRCLHIGGYGVSVKKSLVPQFGIYYQEVSSRLGGGSSVVEGLGA